ncbi:CZF1 [[Candida] subhashii]|uniref:CZF1 n=1 Tax=[Candida] subhashii TaxID=561895 RepID=A0A8J5QGK0_9ASCO|nr:CZF1 [[Candida] subhashii]KAG7661779.1 CZF1 [[Candida] subhashii]
MTSWTSQSWSESNPTEGTSNSNQATATASTALEVNTTSQLQPTTPDSYPTTSTSTNANQTYRSTHPSYQLGPIPSLAQMQHRGMYAAPSSSYPTSELEKPTQPIPPSYQQYPPSLTYFSGDFFGGPEYGGSQMNSNPSVPRQQSHHGIMPPVPVQPFQVPEYSIQPNPPPEQTWDQFGLQTQHQESTSKGTIRPSKDGKKAGKRLSSRRKSSTENGSDSSPKSSTSGSPGGTQPVKKRSRMGCLTCRQRKKRCCETRPRCTECSRLRLKCTWPKPGMEHKNKPKDAKDEENYINHEIYGRIKVLRGIVEYKSK